MTVDNSEGYFPTFPGLYSVLTHSSFICISISIYVRHLYLYLSISETYSRNKAQRKRIRSLQHNFRRSLSISLVHPCSIFTALISSFICQKLSPVDTRNFCPLLQLTKSTPSLSLLPITSISYSSRAAVHPFSMTN